jgi:hypothetical protein
MPNSIPSEASALAERPAEQVMVTFSTCHASPFARQMASSIWLCVIFAMQ